MAVSPSSLGVDPVQGGQPATGTVSLTAPAPAGGATVTLSSSNAAANVPDRVTVSAGQLNAAFTVTASVGASSTGMTQHRDRRVHDAASPPPPPPSEIPTQPASGLHNVTSSVEGGSDLAYKAYRDLDGEYPDCRNDVYDGPRTFSNLEAGAALHVHSESSEE